MEAAKEKGKRTFARTGLPRGGPEGSAGGRIVAEAGEQVAEQSGHFPGQVRQCDRAFVLLDGKDIPRAHLADAKAAPSADAPVIHQWEITSAFGVVSRAASGVLPGASFSRPLRLNDR